MNVATSHRTGPVNPSLKGIKYVIFPDNRIAQVWDFVMILAIWYYSFYIPFNLGISGGCYSGNFVVLLQINLCSYLTHSYHRWCLVFYESYFIFNTIVNMAFFVDTFLAFFRAYRDKNGRIVFNLKTIAKQYIKSGWFFINLLASLPTSSIVYYDARKHLRSGNFEALDNDNTRLYFFLEFFKLLRLFRIKKIMYTSELMSRFWERINIEIALIIKFIFLITMVSHWIGCIWGLIATQQAGGMGDELLNNLNWISHWHESSYVEGGLNPIGWNNAIQRYWLCLFWAIQSITSIGYGNIAPVTAIEFAFANALMLLCGMFWAYIIGNLVEVVQSMGSVNNAYLTRMNEANQMMNDFTVKELGDSAGTVHPNSIKRIRRFITHQRDTATKSWLDTNNACTLHDSYPTLSVLSPELQRVCALHLTRSLLETIPYLSSEYLSPEEQAEIAFQCVSIEFSAAEEFVAHPELGRGILIFRQGFAVTSRNAGKKSFVWKKDLADKPIDVNEVLVEDDYFKHHQLVYHFIGFTKVWFVPRSAILAVLQKNERAWKECARWRYFMASLVLYSLKDTTKTFDDFNDCL
ncbi:hypothetical protein ACHAXR_006440 [Thalassiosira sp. AJA248-18]